MMVQAALLRAIDHPGTVVLTGLPGTGKTLLLAELAQAARIVGRRVALLRHAGDEPEDASDVLLIDEADKLGPAQLAQLQADHPVCVLAGLPGLLDHFPAARGSTTTLVLTPLQPQEARRFVLDQLASSDGPNLSMDDEACSLIVGYAAGIPRNLQVVTGAAAFVADLEGSTTVLPPHVRAAIEMRFGAEDDHGTQPRSADRERPAQEVAAASSSHLESDTGTDPVETPRSAVVAPLTAIGAERRNFVWLAYVGIMTVLAIGVIYAGPGSRPAPVTTPAPTADASASTTVLAPPAPAVAPASGLASNIVATGTATASSPRAPSASIDMQLTAPQSNLATNRPSGMAIAGGGGAASTGLEAMPGPVIGRAIEAVAPVRSAAPTASAEYASKMEALPALAAPRILFTYPERDAPSAQAAQALAARFMREGAIVPGAQARPASRTRGVLFFFAEDAPAARTLAQKLGVQARPAGRVADLPPGTIEVALPIAP